MNKLVDGIEVPLTQEEIDEFNERETAHEAANIEYEKVAYRDRRREKYNQLGVTNEARTDALWEKIVENKPESADALQIIRQKVKDEEPKPT